VLERWRGAPDLTSWRSAVLVVALGLLSACGPTIPTGSVPPTGPPVAVVTLGIYSGRPDPSWSLTSAEAATLDAMLTGLVEMTDTPALGGLGYHGFTITTPTRTFVAYRGAIAPPGSGARAMKVDPARSVERFLLETSRAHVTPEEFATAQLAIGSP
jgi:hypothetical protein